VEEVTAALRAAAAGDGQVVPMNRGAQQNRAGGGPQAPGVA
jgi:hypothetical protein